MLIHAIILATATATAPITNPEEEFCNTIGDFAQTIMTARQGEVLASKLISLLPTDNELARAVGIDIVEDAFRSPNFDTPELEQEAIREFRNHWEIQCYQAN